MMMANSAKFISYGFLSSDDLPVGWLTIDTSDERVYDLIRAAGYEPEDPTVQVGVLQSPWGEHEEGCMVVCYGSLLVGERFAVSEKPVVWTTELR